MATFLFRAYLLSGLKHFRREYLGVTALYAIRLAIYIDDLVLQISGVYLSGVVCKAANLIRILSFGYLEQELVSPSARDKRFLVGSSTEIVDPVL